MHNKTIKQSRSRSRHGPGDKPLVPSRSRPELFFTGPLAPASGDEDGDQARAGGGRQGSARGQEDDGRATEDRQHRV